MSWLWISLAVALGLYLLFLLVLVLTGRRVQARAWAGVIPDCLVFTRRLLRHPDVPRRRKVALALLLGYLAMPFDLVPDFLPVVGQLDDVVLVALVLRYVFRGAEPGLVEELWPGPQPTLDAVLRLSGRGAVVA
jgi:uncharacterized membrane protein YkvA (DUF1232 family)